MAMKETPDFVDFCLNVPLYEKFQINSYQHNKIVDFHYDVSIKFDCYCIDCGKSSTFAPLEKIDIQKTIDRSISLQVSGKYDIVTIRDVLKAHAFIRHYKCLRVSEHTGLKFVFYIKFHSI